MFTISSRIAGLNGTEIIIAPHTVSIRRPKAERAAVATCNNVAQQLCQELAAIASVSGFALDDWHPESNPICAQFRCGERNIEHDGSVQFKGVGANAYERLANACVAALEQCTNAT